MRQLLLSPLLITLAIGSVPTSAQAPVLLYIAPPGIVGPIPQKVPAPIAIPVTSVPGDGKFLLPFKSQKWPPVIRDGRFGSRRGYGWHDGIDFAVNYRTQVYAARTGVVVRMERFDPARDYGHGYGGFVVVRHADGSHTWYAHLDKIFVKIGQKVTHKTLLALSGGRNNGHSSGPHLHFSVFRPDGEALNPAIAIRRVAATTARNSNRIQ